MNPASRITIAGHRGQSSSSRPSVPGMLSSLRLFPLLTGELEPFNEPYAVAKIAGIKVLTAGVKQHEKRDSGSECSR